MSVHEHKADSFQQVSAFVVTVSDTRCLKNDLSGDLICGALEREGHEVVGREIVRDVRAEIRAIVAREIESSSVALVVLTGGTGISLRDVTPEALEPIIERGIPGFGELFRQLSYREIGSAAMLSRAFAGVAQGTLVIALPGSPDAVDLAMKRLILPELRHLTNEVTKGTLQAATGRKAKA